METLERIPNEATLRINCLGGRGLGRRLGFDRTGEGGTANRDAIARL